MDVRAVDQRSAGVSAERLVLDVVEQTLRELQPDAHIALRVTPASTLDRDLGLDSLGRVQLLLRIESAFRIDLPQDTLQTAATVRDLLVAVERAGARGAVRPPASGAERQIELPVRERGAGPSSATTLLEMLDWHVQAHGEQLQIVVLAEDVAHEITYDELAARARVVAASLQRAGLAPRQTVALMLPTAPEYFSCFFGILMAGGIPVPIYPPPRAAQLEEHVLRHARILANAQTVLMIAVPEAMVVARLLQARVPGLRRVLTPAQLGAGAAAQAHQTGIPAGAHPDTPTPVRIECDDVAFVQYTSGSTGNPKGVVLTHSNLLANIRAMAQTVAATPSDIFVSWLPLYHDMGLIGAVFGSLYVGMPLVVMSPLAFLARPERWLRAIDRYRGTISAGPNFAYELCLKRIDDAALAGLDLSSLRLAFNGAEPVNPNTIARFAERFARCGLKRTAITPVYGLAEASVGLLFPPLNRGPLIDCVERETLARDHRAVPAQPGDPTAQFFVTCGRVLPGHAVRIVDDAGSEVGERIEGRLEFKGPSATQGYFRNPAETARLFHDGWLDTGDRAYVAAGEIYLTGRVKDIVIRGGRNIYPQEIEDEVGAVSGVRKGCVAVFGSTDADTGTERLIVLAETALQDERARTSLRAAVSHAVLDSLGEPPDAIVLAPPHTVLKTSSGKVRRSACRALYESGRIGAPPVRVPWQMVRLAVGALGPRARGALSAIRQFAFACYALTLFALLAPTTWLVTLFARSPRAAWQIGHGAARLLLRLARIPFRVRGVENLPKAGACVLVSNHASYLDGLILAAALPEPFGFVAKRELRDQFVAGRYLARLGAQFVERVDVKRSVEDANRMAALVAAGHSLIVFPEGTFVARPGLLPFRLGAFLAAAGANAPVVPVTIRGTRDVLPDGRWWPERHPIEVEIGAPIDSSGREGADVFARAVGLRTSARATIERCVQRPAIV